ncbi:zinc finger transcription factor ace1 [Podospora fimiseda]|uniref:Zinc finger transcription factor ace1 n=1 Tax=Podospora fimiseda TaxID=252190 RepID=A0AAN7BWG3_9PEZI|nr:zinc finger transcription factor ace1 [Podospora fimiseda]
MSTNPRRTPVTRPDSSSLSLKTSSLKKGSTFHSPSSPSSSLDNVFRPPSLPRRSQSSLDDVLDAHRRSAALALDEFDKKFIGLSLDDSPSKAVRPDVCPIPRGVLVHTLDSVMAKEEKETQRKILRPRTRRASRHHESDSGLGTSVTSTDDEKATPTKQEKAVKTSTVTRSAASRAASTEASLSGLSARGTNRICEYTLKPILAKPALKEFHPLLLECPKKIQDRDILCLRDLEKTLLLVAPEKTKSVGLYLDFCLTTIRCIQATVQHLPEREQTRPRDVPYSNGYFIDLVDQIRQYAGQLRDVKEKGELDVMDVDPTEEIKLHGGIHINGRPAELVRVKKSGKMISMATGEMIESIEEEASDSVRIKRSASQELEDEEEILRSMARRKKNATPEELAPKKCREPGCNKEFKRPCDLTKHEKTHSRPWKCPVPTCKYHEYGWPTEKEMDRHHNDKHSSSPAMYECYYKPCPYKSKRESNCKQHMEKAHGWTYVRTKTNGKKSGSSVAGNSVNQHPTPLLEQSMPTPSSEHSMGIATPPSDWSGLYGGGHSLDFPTYLPDSDFSMIPQEINLDYSPIDNPTPSTDSGMDHSSAYQDVPGDFVLFEDIYSANAQLSSNQHVDIYTKSMTPPYQFPALTSAEMGNPQPAQISPVGQGNTMLYTPESMTHEGFDDNDFATMANTIGSGDFILFPPQVGVSKSMFNESLFATAEMTGMTNGFTQQPSSSQDLLNAFHCDWSAHDLNAYLPQ